MLKNNLKIFVNLFIFETFLIILLSIYKYLFVAKNIYKFILEMAYHYKYINRLYTSMLF
jgi:hypothetical protein